MIEEEIVYARYAKKGEVFVQFAIVQHLEQIQSPDSVGVRGEQKAKAKIFFEDCNLNE